MTKNIKNPYLPLIVFIGINLFLFSSVSPLHSIMNMQYNEWLYYLIGKGLINGLVPYRDLLDHKGPYLFYFFGIANIISYKHIGLFLLALFIYSLIAIFSYKITLLILSNENEKSSSSMNSIISFFVAFLIYFIISSYYMSFGTISSEAFTLPFMFMSYYLFLSFLYNNSSYKLKNMSVYGICAGIAFFIKANAVLSYVPIAIYLLFYFLRRKEFKNLFLNFIVGLSSFIIALLPAVIYSLATNSFHDMIDGAFTVNILYTGTGMPSSASVYESLIETITTFKEFTILCFLSIFALFYFLNPTKENKKLKSFTANTSGIMIFYIFSLMINIYSVYMSCRPYTNYLAYLLFYLIPLIAFLAKGFLSLCKTRPIITLCISILLINVLAYSFTYEISDTNGRIQRTISDKAIKIYNKYEHKKSKPNLLVVGYAPYLYEAFDTLPNEKYFATPVVSRKKYSKPYDAILNRIKKSDEDLVIVAFERAMIKDKSFQENVLSALDEAYINIGSADTLGQKIDIYALKNEE